MKFKDYYKILGVDIEADSDTIKKKFRQLVKQYHPDSCVNKTKEEQEKNAEFLKLIYEAYDTLKDDLKRLEYDQKYYKYMSNKRKKQQEEKASSPLEKVQKKVKRAYKEVKREEKQKSFTKRHNVYSKLFEEELKGNSATVNLKKGTLHVCAEAIYQFSKLRKLKGDSAIKYVLRNRKIICVSIAGIFIVSGINNTNSEVPIEIAKYQTTTEENKNVTDKILLTRFYTVKSGDTLESLSNECNTPVHMLKALNNKYSSDINVGEKLLLRYNIGLDDLKYYIYSVLFDKTISLAEFAEKYDTNIDDLITLNEDAIINDNGVYAVLSDYLYVPKYITKEELTEKKYYK